MIQNLAKLNTKQIIIVGIVVSILNSLFIVSENFWGLLIPFALVIVALIVLALDKVLLFIVFATPLSIFYYNPDLRVGFTLPTEPLLFGLMILFFFKILYRGGFDSKIVSHPISIAILLNVAWMLITTITSEIPFVSVKFLLARLWFVSVFFYLMSQIFKKRKSIDVFFWLFMISLSIAVVYTVVVHSQNGFTRQASTWVMFPFFKEHTSYGAVLAMFIPISFIYAFLYKHNRNARIGGFFLFSILSIGVVLSFTRAAWLSIVVAVIVMLFVVLRVRKEVIALLAIMVLGFLLYNQEDILKKFEKNEQVSSDNLTEHVESISNISTDASNLERINRWKSAFRMFEERPILGFGPGTYMFLYAPYQKPSEKTIISTNAADMGNAHSEYIGPLAESGLFGAISVLLIVFATVYYGILIYYKLDDHNLKLIAMACLMGLITYWTHGFLNNFLEMDKASCPVWGFSSILVVLDRYFTKKKTV